jgi:hypothetical protein
MRPPSRYTVMWLFSVSERAAWSELVITVSGLSGRIAASWSTVVLASK